MGFTCINHMKHCFKYRLKGVRFLAGVRNCSVLHSVQTGPGAHPASYSTRTGVFPGRVKRKGLEDDHSLPYSVEV
jgi:hypothetical protein